MPFVVETAAGMAVGYRLHSSELSVAFPAFLLTVVVDLALSNTV